MKSYLFALIGFVFGYITRAILPTDRRIQPDRRRWAHTGFPLVDSAGRLTVTDRRTQPDRRLSNIRLD